MNRLLLSTCALALLAASPALRAADVAPAQPVIPDRVFHLTDYAAVGDGHTLNTGAFRRAIDALEYAGGGTLVVPPGRWLTQPLNLDARINLRLEAGATVVFTGNPDDSRIRGNRFRPFLLASDVHDVMISGAACSPGAGKSVVDP